jgi:rRNA maturation protein Nop10
LVREICKDIRKISLENQLNKSQIKAISEVKKISEGAYQHIVNNTQSSDTLKNENKNQGEKTASIFPLKDSPVDRISKRLNVSQKTVVESSEIIY